MSRISHARIEKTSQAEKECYVLYVSLQIKGEEESVYKEIAKNGAIKYITFHADSCVVRAFDDVSILCFLLSWRMKVDRLHFLILLLIWAY